MHPELPPAIGPYRPVEMLAEGGMARVAVARHDAGWVALKLIRPELTDDDEYTTMFLDEARINSRVEHPNVVGVVDYGRCERTQIVFMAMELVLGATLAEVARSRAEPLPTGLVLSLVAQAADGLAAAHTARAEDGTPLDVVHRDVSPQNLLVGFDGRLRVSDFGVARASQRATRTKTGQFKGKLRYCAPEQALGGTVDRASDVFALGIVAWELLADRGLFDGRTPFETLDAIMNTPIRRTGRLRDDLPEDAATVLDAMLARERGARPGSTAAIGAALRDAITAAGLDTSGIAEVVHAAASPIACQLAGLPAPARPVRTPPPGQTSGVTAVARPRRVDEPVRTASGGWLDGDEELGR